MLNEQDLNREMLTLKIIFFAMLFSLAMYLIIGIAVGDTVKTGNENTALGMIRPVLYVMACVLLFIAKPVKKSILLETDIMIIC